MQKVVERILVNYEKLGEAKKNLVILHGWAASGDEWKDIASELSEKYTVWVIDLPGFGGSGKPGETWGINEYAEWMKVCLEKMGIKKTIIIGHSFGGRLAILLAARSNLIERLILVDAAGMEMKALKTRLYKVFLKVIPVSLVKLVIPEGMRNALRSEDYRAAGELHEVFERVISQPLGEELKKIQVPTLIIWGEKDVILV